MTKSLLAARASSKFVFFGFLLGVVQKEDGYRLLTEDLTGTKVFFLSKRKGFEDLSLLLSGIERPGCRVRREPLQRTLVAKFSN